MKKIILLIIVNAVFYCSFSQYINKLDTIYSYQKGIIGISVFDTAFIQLYKNQKSQANILINGCPIDSTGIWTSNVPLYYENNIFINSTVGSLNKSNKQKVYFSLTNKVLINYDCNFEYSIGSNVIYSFDELYSKVYIVNPLNCQKKLVVDFYDQLKKETIEGKTYPIETINKLFFFNKNNLIVEFCTTELENCTNFRYVLVENNQIKDITDIIMPEFSTDTYQAIFVEFERISPKSDFLTIRYSYLGNKSCDNKVITKLFTSDFIKSSDVLSFNSPLYVNNKGISVQNNELTNYMISSTLNSGDKVIVPFRFNPELEKLMYTSFYDGIVEENNLNVLDSLELKILKNLILAKHNYDFGSEFYQGYFNLYAFYNTPEMRNSRKKEVYGKLTRADKTNLELIKSME